MSSGQFVKMGTKWGTTYPEKGNNMADLIDDFYNGQYAMFGSVQKSLGDAKYGVDGMFNAIMGKEITSVIFSSKNTFAALGARPYNHEGVRLAYEQADYGLASADMVGAGGALAGQGFYEGDFVGIGATTPQDGNIPAPVMIPVLEVRQPFKETPMTWQMGTSLDMLSNKDDVASNRDYAKLMGQHYADLVDKTLLRPMHLRQPKAANGVGTSIVETSLQGIARAIGSYSEVGTMENGIEITKEMVTPYGGLSSDMYSFRGTKASALDGNVVDLKGEALPTLDDLDQLYAVCSVNWEDQANPNNKAWFMSNLQQVKYSQQMKAHNILLDAKFVSRSFNGVKLTEGREAGMLVNTYLNVPIIQDGNFNYDYANKRVSATETGPTLLLDMDHIWMSVLHPIQYWSNDNPALIGGFYERNVMNTRMELRIDRFNGQGRIIGGSSA